MNRSQSVFAILDSFSQSHICCNEFKAISWRVFNLVFKFESMNLNTMLASRLKEVRGEIPQGVFAESVGINKSSWGRYERGETEPSSSDLTKICFKYEISAEWILFGQGPMHIKDRAKSSERSGQRHASTVETGGCAQCAKLEAEQKEDRQERREMSTELREVNAENRRLWQENSDLRERCARFEEKQASVTIG